MRLLNIGCGSVRPQDPKWTNLDNLRKQLKEGTPERINLDKETNYVDHDIQYDNLPFEDNTFDGILCSHVVEHFDAQGAVSLLEDCRRVLKPGGVLVISVPDAAYFLSVHKIDTPENAIAVFGEPICPSEPWHKSFFDYALFYNQHKQVLTMTSLTCLIMKAGFEYNRSATLASNPIDVRIREIEKLMNRRKFSVEMYAMKQSS